MRPVGLREDLAVGGVKPARDLAGHFHAIEVRHVHVANDGVRIELGGKCDGFHAIGGFCQDFEAFRRYVDEHQVQTAAFFAAIPDETLMRLRPRPRNTISPTSKAVDFRLILRSEE